MTLTVIPTSSKKTVETAMFDHLAHPSIVAQAVRVYLANQRAGLAKTKTRGEVDMTKKKWFKQKGTGNARHGAQSAPIFVGGGVAHGPRGNANWKLSMSKTMRRRALQTALGLQSAEGKVHVVTTTDAFMGKTKDAAAFLTENGLQNKATLLVVQTWTEEMDRATRNLPMLLVVTAANLNPYLVMRAHTILLTQEATQVLEAKFATAEAAQPEAEVKVEKPVKKAVAKKTTKQAKAE